MADFITELSERRVLPAAGVYVAGSWVLIEILDRQVDRYLLSPYLTDIVFWGLFSLIPAVMLVAWTHGKRGKDKATRAEKVGVPINLIATIGLLITVFGDKDLEQAATQITVDNELGQQETHYIPSETFRRRMAVFFWENESGNPELDWLQYGVTELLVQDLQQDPFVARTSQDKLYVRQWAALLEARLGRIHEAIRQTYEQKELMLQTQTPLAVALGIYSSLVNYYLSLGFSEAMLFASQGDFIAANEALERAVEVIDRFKLQLMKFQVPVTRAWISKEQGEYKAMAEYFIESLDMMEHSVLAGELSIAIPQVYAEAATGQVRSGQLDAAEKSLTAGFRLDPSEPMLWLAKARLQQARDMPRLALASANYALAIWQDADVDFILYQQARTLAEEISVRSN